MTTLRTALAERYQRLAEHDPGWATLSDAVLRDLTRVPDGVLPAIATAHVRNLDEFEAQAGIDAGFRHGVSLG